jgi:hypothetical protein
MDRCVICGCPVPEGYQVCPNCEICKIPPVGQAKLFVPPAANVELSFGSGVNFAPNFQINYHRTKPLNKFQIWMFKFCFGVTAKNI